MGNHFHKLNPQLIDVSKVSDTSCEYIKNIESDLGNFYAFSCEEIRVGVVNVEITVNEFIIGNIFNETQNLENRHFVSNSSLWKKNQEKKLLKYASMKMLGRACTPDTKISINNELIVFTRSGDSGFYMPMTAFMDDITHSPSGPKPGEFFACLNKLRFDELEFYNSQITSGDISHFTDWRLVSYDMPFPGVPGLIYFDRGHASY